MITLNTEIKNLYGVGKTISNRLKRLGINNVKDLLFYFPWRYEDYSSLTPINKLSPGAKVNIVGEVEMVQNKRSPRKRISITEAIVSDGESSIKVIWFNQPFITKNLNSGDKVSLAGKIEGDKFNIIMKSPVYEKITNQNTIHTQGLIPVYHLTANITQKQIRYLIKQSLPAISSFVDWLPKEVLKRQKLINLSEAIKIIHFPKNQKDIKTARRRLAFNELLTLQLKSLVAKNEIAKSRSQAIIFKEKETVNFVNSLPFKLTNAQKKSAWEILLAMEKTKPMSRLLEGDVGSGKTIVALIAMLNVALNKKQAILMAPTEILAMQHYRSISKMLKNKRIKIGLISRNNKIIGSKKEKNSGQKIAYEADIIIGTHAIIQEKIKFRDLGLAIIDEQHRFGVAQRKELTLKSGNKKTTPHLLSMTATPIPRSLGLALYGDLDLSIIDEMPLNRKKIITKIVNAKNRKNAYEFVNQQIKNGRQTFVICPLVDFSDKLGVKSAKEEQERLQKKIFPNLSIGLLHGRLQGKEKDKIMQNFLANKINILVSTSVVEVGVDIPNATIMIIEDAERFGLAQLHQFRGRVGRGKHQSYCLLFTNSTSPNTLKRLNALVNNTNGFKLAQIDLELRGPGEVFGINQSGFPELKIANLLDYELMQKAKAEAEILIKSKKFVESDIIKEKINKNIHLE